MLKNNKVISYIFVLIWIFILFFIALKQYDKMQENFDNKRNAQILLEEKEKKLVELNEIKKIIKSWDFENNISKYILELNENDLLEYFYNYAYSTKLKWSRISIKNISIWEWVKNQIWFLQSDINLNIRVESKDALIKYLDYIFDKESKYVFYIDTLNFPNDGKEWSFDVKVPLKMYYIN